MNNLDILHLMSKCMNFINSDFIVVLKSS